jgi:ribosomal protein L37E
MPPAKVTAWILKPGAKPFEFFDEDGTSRHLPIFFNNENTKETVQCNRCGEHVNFAHLVHHQKAVICDQKAKSKERMLYQNAEWERHAETLHILTENSPPFQVRSQRAFHTIYLKI